MTSSTEVSLNLPLKLYVSRVLVHCPICFGGCPHKRLRVGLSNLLHPTISGFGFPLPSSWICLGNHCPPPCPLDFLDWACSIILPFPFWVTCCFISGHFQVFSPCWVLA